MGYGHLGVPWVKRARGQSSFHIGNRFRCPTRDQAHELTHGFIGH